MVGAIHGWWCNARTYPTVCHYCGQRVFYFSCDCGCKVFFDELGPPWPQHMCLPYLEATYGHTQAVHLFEAHRLRLGEEISIEPEYTQTLLEHGRNPSRPHRLVRQDPTEGSRVQEIGYLREIGPSQDAYKAFDLLRSPISRALLGSLADRRYIPITLHTGDLSREDGGSYTGVIDAESFSASKARRGDLVRFSLIAWGIPGRSLVWLCQRLARVGLR